MDKNVNRKKETVFSSNKLNDCPMYNFFNPDVRLQELQDPKRCTRCTAWDHPTKKCPLNWKCKWNNQDKSKCNEPHHASLHKVKQHITSLARVTAACVSENNPFCCDFRLIEAQKISVQNDQESAIEANALHDSASSITLCIHDWAKKLGLKSQD